LVWEPEGTKVSAKCLKWLESWGRDVFVARSWPLANLWERVVEMADRPRKVVVVDDSINAPLSCFAANVAMPTKEFTLLFYTIHSRSPRGATVKEDERRISALKKKFLELPVLTKALKSLGYMSSEGWGYHPERMEPRWNAILRSFGAFSSSQHNPHLMVDWGSNEGYFSVQLVGFQIFFFCF
jgi:hypothetical protein